MESSYPAPHCFSVAMEFFFIAYTEYKLVGSDVALSSV